MDRIKSRVNEAISRYKSGESIAKILFHSGISSGCLYKELRLRRIDFRKRHVGSGASKEVPVRRKKLWERLDPEAIREMFVTQRMSRERISVRLNVATPTVNRAIGFHGISRPKVSASDEEVNRRIVSLYQEGYSERKVLELIGVGIKRISIVLVEAGLKVVRKRQNKCDHSEVVASVADGLPTNEISEKFGISSRRVYAIVEKTAPAQEVNWEAAGREYQGNARLLKIAAKYGTTTCRLRRELERMGVAIRQYGLKREFCARARFVNKAGYVCVHLDSADPFYGMADQRGYVLEHRLVMARHVNRELGRFEPVHHKNHVKADNRIENLSLMTPGAHTIEGLVYREYKKVRRRLEKITTKPLPKASFIDEPRPLFSLLSEG